MSYLRHPLDIGSLVLGLIYLGVVAAWGLFELDVLSGDDAAWLLPAVLVTAGVLGIVLAATKERRAPRPGDLAYGYPAPAAADSDLDTHTHAHTDTQAKERHDD